METEYSIHQVAARGISRGAATGLSMDTLRYYERIGLLEPARQAAQRRLQEIHPPQAEDVAHAIVYAVSQPPHVNVNEILLRPTEQDR
jgi:NADP-dependent 3-hydroxy acid dehydrogenase YdfG